MIYICIEEKKCLGIKHLFITWYGLSTNTIIIIPQHYLQTITTTLCYNTTNTQASPHHYTTTPYQNTTTPHRHHHATSHHTTPPPHHHQSPSRRTLYIPVTRPTSLMLRKLLRSTPCIPLDIAKVLCYCCEMMIYYDYAFNFVVSFNRYSKVSINLI